MSHIILSYDFKPNLTKMLQIVTRMVTILPQVSPFWSITGAGQAFLMHNLRSKGGLIRWNFSFKTLEFLFRKESVEIFQEAKRVSWYIIQFAHTIKFHSYDHDKVSLIKRINNYHFSCHRYYSFKPCLKILKKRS